MNHFIRPRQHCRRDGQAKGLRSLEVDDELKPGRLFHREIGGLCSFQNPIHVLRRVPTNGDVVRRIREEGTLLHPVSSLDRHWEPSFKGEPEDQGRERGLEARRDNCHPINVARLECTEDSFDVVLISDRPLD
jgi:hypothetical protein